MLLHDIQESLADLLRHLARATADDDQGVLGEEGVHAGALAPDQVLHVDLLALVAREGREDLEPQLRDRPFVPEEVVGVGVAVAEEEDGVVYCVVLLEGVGGALPD